MSDKRTFGPLDVPDSEMLERLGRDYLQRAVEFQKAAAEHGLLHRGWRFFPPYACCYCGLIISARQFAFARCCGGCDVGGSRTARLSMFERKWFLAGRVVDERTGHPLDINPTFIPAAEAEDYPVRRRVPPRSPRRAESY